jgi:solute:Na+ symporter, SSS family
VLKHRLTGFTRALVLVAMLAALMSTLSGTLHGVGSALFVRDIYQNVLRPAARDRELIFVAYAATVVIVALGFYVGLGARSLNHLWAWLMIGFSAGVFAPRLLRLYWWRCNAWGCAAGIAAGGGAAVIQRLLWPDLAEWLIFVLTAGLGLIATLLVSMLTRPAPADVVRAFYRRTRPFGAWGPFWRELPAEEKKAWRAEHRHDQCALPFALLTQVTLFLVPMQLVVHAYAQFWLTLPWFLLGIAGLYVFWWRALPRA